MLNKKIKKFEIHPAFHYSIGGILTNQYGKTNFENVYAVGECTTGLHGVNRIGGTAISECIIFSKILADNIETFENKINEGKIVYCEKVKEAHKNLFWEKLGIVKYKSELEKLRNLKGDFILEFAAEMAKQAIEYGNIGLNIII